MFERTKGKSLLEHQGRKTAAMVVTTAAAAGKTAMSMKKQDEDVSSIISRLIAKGHALLGADATEKLVQLKPKVTKIEVAVREEKDVVVGISTPRTDQLRVFLSQFRSTFHGAEDTLDKVVARHAKIVSSLPEGTNPFFEQTWAKKKFGSVFHTVSCGTGTEIKKLNKSIDEVRTVIDEVHKNMSAIEGAGLLPIDRRTTGVPPAKVFGRFVDCERIVGMLHRTVGYEDQQGPGCCPYSVVGLHGAPGCGKTTLAQLVYARVDEARYFDLAMWVHVSRDFTAVDDVFADMMEAATGRAPCCHHDAGAMQGSLEKELGGKRVFLVLDLDDVGSSDGRRMERLRRILAPLEFCERDSKVLVTSRTADTLLALGATKARIVPVPELPEDVFHQLLLHFALQGSVADERDRSILEVIGADIAKKLNRSPLAARTVGEKLRTSKSIEVWRSVLGALQNQLGLN